MPNAWFIAGTDTEIGKTYVAASWVATLLSQSDLRVDYIKPVQTGIADASTEGDAHWVEAQCLKLNPSWQERFSTETPYCYPIPAAPAVADTEKTLNLTQLTLHCLGQLGPGKHTVLEGAGGLMVPLTQECLTIDWIKQLHTQKPVETILVTSNRLGTINHTLLSVEALQARGLPIAAVVVNQHNANDTPYSVAQATASQLMKAFLPQDLPVIEMPYSATQQPNTTVLKSLLQNTHALGVN
jgi:dethiobiotin synthetase